MRVRRFFASDMRQALGMVREELGGDAVILSNQKVAGGVELVAALDYVAPASADTEVPGAQKTAHLATPLATQQEMAHSRYAIQAAREAEEADDDSPAALWRRQPVGEAVAAGRTAEASGRQIASTRPVNAVAIDLSAREEMDAMRSELAELRQLLGRALAQQPTAAESSADVDDDIMPALPQLRPAAHGRRGHNGSDDNTMGRTMGRDAQRVISALSTLEIGDELARDIVHHLPAGLPAARLWQQALARLAKLIPIAPQQELIEQQGIIALVGPTGVGKTTTLGKLAARFVLRYGAEHLALLTTDCHRIGTHEQLRTLGRILNVPVRVVDSRESFDGIMTALGKRRLCLVDTAGGTLRDPVFAEQMKLLRSIKNLSSCLLLPATADSKVLERSMADYRALKPKVSILTKLDECASLGCVLARLIEGQLPLTYVTDGQRIPDDLHLARSASLVSQAVSMQKAWQDRFRAAPVRKTVTSTSLVHPA